MKKKEIIILVSVIAFITLTIIEIINLVVGDNSVATMKNGKYYVLYKIETSGYALDANDRTLTKYL